MSKKQEFSIASKVCKLLKLGRTYKTSSFLICICLVFLALMAVLFASSSRYSSVEKSLYLNFSSILSYPCYLSSPNTSLKNTDILGWSCRGILVPFLIKKSTNRKSSQFSPVIVTLFKFPWK